MPKIISFQFPLLFLQILHISAKNLLIPNEASALLAFKSKADLNHNLNFFPNTALAFCNWTGVQCSNHKPVRVVLEGLSLTGVFQSDTLTRLDQLRVLSLSNNSLTGPIPNLSGLTNLKSLFLNHNRFSGSVQSSIATVHRLRTLDLSFNLLSGPIPVKFKDLDRLIYLRLDSNRLTGPVPPLNQSSLKVFNVSKNNLTGPVPVTPVLVRFGSFSFLSNPNLCGKIVERECHTQPTFFSQSPPPPAAAELSQTESSRSATEPTRPRHKRTAMIVGFVSGALILVSSVLCLAMAVKKRRRGREKGLAEPIAASDYSVAAHVARIEEDEVGERVRRVQGLQIVKSGILVFCAGEAQVFTLDQLMKGSAELIGRGSLGNTYKALLDNSMTVTVKRLDAARFAGVGKEEFERQMGSVGGLRHPNLVPVRAYFQAKEERLVVYDYQENGSLFSLIHGSKSTRAKPLHWTSCLKIAEDVAQGLSYIHQAWRLVHGNLKSTNVLLGSDFEACLTDYSLSPLAPSSPDPSQNLHKDQYTSKSDVYSFGVLLLEILSGEPSSNHPSLELEGMIKWVKGLRKEDGEGDYRLDMLVDVAVSCRATSAEQRPTMWQVLKMIQEVKEEAVVQSGELLVLNGASVN